jgi:hypothetical protein
VKANKAVFLVFLITLSLCLVNVQPTKAAEATENTWTTMASMPTPRAGLGVAVVNGKIYAIGGRNEDYGYLNTNEDYDPATNTWTTRKPMPTRRSNFGIAVYQSKIYVIGGQAGADSWNGADILSSSNEVYDPLTDTWETKTSLPTLRRGLDANVVDGKIYLIGGYRISSPGGGIYLQEFNVTEVYDPAADTWITMAPLPTAVYNYASAVVNNKIYVIGGPDKLNQIYDPKTDTWSFGAEAPEGVYGAAAGATNGIWAPKRIYVLGGGSIIPGKANYVYDPERDVWVTGTLMPTARDGLDVAVVDDVLYAIGGKPGWMGGLEGVYYVVNEQYMPFGYGTVSPTISIASPEKNATYSVNNVSLAFTVNKPVVSMSYSLDGQENETITGSTTLTGLPEGMHNLTVYANDTAGNMGASETIYFTIAQQSESFPTTWIAAATVIIVTGVIVTLGVIIYRKKRSASKKTP